MKPHYYVFTKFEKMPGRETLAEATAEAEQLAAQNPGTSFEILQCLGVSSVPKASTVWINAAEPEPKAGLGWLDAEIEKESSQYAEAVAAYDKAESECRNSSDDYNRASYYKGRRDALTGLKNLGKETK